MLLMLQQAAYQIAVPCSLIHGHWLCVCVCEMPGHGPLHRWQRGPVIMLQLMGHRGPDRQSLRAVFGPRAGLCRPLVYIKLSLHVSIELWLVC